MKIANAVQSNIIKNNGGYVPDGLRKGIPTMFSIDNLDCKVDTPDGKDSFHGTASTVYQRSTIEADDHQTHSGLDIVNAPATKLCNIPKSVLPLYPCLIIGSPKPKASPRYTNFYLGKYDNLLIGAELNVAWQLARYKSRTSSTITSTENTNEMNTLIQDIPLWAAYNSEVSNQENQSIKDKYFALPIINAPAHEWSTLITSLTHIYNINQAINFDENVALSVPQSRVSVWLDMDLFKRAVKLAYLDDQYRDKWIVHPGQLHTSFCYICCLGNMVENSGLDQCWVEAELYSTVTVHQIITGKHYNRAIDCHLTTLQVLSDLWFEEIFKEYPEVEERLSALVIINFHLQTTITLLQNFHA